MKTAALATVLALTVLAGVVFGGLDVHGAQGASLTTPTPEQIAGHDVLIVQNSENTVCYADTVPTVTLASSATGQEAFLSTSAPDMAAVDQGLRNAGFPEGTRVTFVGSGITQAMVNSAQDNWNAAREANGCIKFGGPLDDEPEQTQSIGPAGPSLIS